jgi:HAMP domain-containing protein
VLLPAADLPRGRTLQSLLLATAQRRDLPTMRDLLTAWQSGPAAGVAAGQIVVSEPSLDLVALAPAGEPLRALRAFAAEVIAGGYAHLWPIPADEAELTAVLAGMTGRELEPADVPPADRPTSHAVGDLLADRERLTRELAEAKAKHEWYESMLSHREAELKRVRRMNALLAATVPGKAATTLVGGLRAGKRAVRSVVRRTRGS